MELTWNSKRLIDFTRYSIVVRDHIGNGRMLEVKLEANSKNNQKTTLMCCLNLNFWNQPTEMTFISNHTNLFGLKQFILFGSYI